MHQCMYNIYFIVFIPEQKYSTNYYKNQTKQKNFKIKMKNISVQTGGFTSISKELDNPNQ